MGASQSSDGADLLPIGEARALGDGDDHPVLRAQLQTPPARPCLQEMVEAGAGGVVVLESVGGAGLLAGREVRARGDGDQAELQPQLQTLHSRPHSGPTPHPASSDNRQQSGTDEDIAALPPLPPLIRKQLTFLGLAPKAVGLDSLDGLRPIQVEKIVNDKWENVTSEEIAVQPDIFPIVRNMEYADESQRGGLETDQTAREAEFWYKAGYQTAQAGYQTACGEWQVWGEQQAREVMRLRAVSRLADEGAGRGGREMKVSGIDALLLKNMTKQMTGWQCLLCPTIV